MSQPAEVARYAFRHQADMAAGLLEDAGIDSVVVADDAGGMYAGIAPARLIVAPDDVDRAREVLAEFHDSLEPDADE